MNQAATTVVVNDLSVAVGHKQNVNRLTIAILNALAEEGSYKIAMPKMAHLDLGGRTVNVIACCIPELISDKRNWWYRSGFMSRLLIVKFAHSISLQLGIHKSIQDGHTDVPATVLKVPSSTIKVEISDQSAASLHMLAARVFQAYGEAGYRKHKQIRGLACGHALSRSWKHPKIELPDIEFIEQCLPFLIEGSQI